MTLDCEVFGVSDAVADVNLVCYEEVLIELRLESVYLVCCETVCDHEFPGLRQKLTQLSDCILCVRQLVPCFYASDQVESFWYFCFV